MFFDFNFNHIIKIIKYTRQRENNLNLYMKHFTRRLTRNELIL